MKQKTGVFAVLTAALLLGSTMVGCGGDDDTTSGTTGGSGGTGGTGGAGAGGKGGTGGSTGGTGGTGGTAGDAGGKGGTAGSDGGSDAPNSLTCGNKICGPIVTSVGLTLSPCCPAGETNTCGGTVAQAMDACITTTPGTADTTCPSIMAQIPLAGCCRPNGMCGLNFSLLGLGCADPTPLGGMGNVPCGRDGGPPADTGPADTGPGDTGPGDTGPGDTGPGDTGPGDTGPGDTGPGDTGPGDTGPGDTGDSAPPNDAPAG